MLAHCGGRLLVGQHHGGLGGAQHGGEVTGVAWLVGIVERNRNHFGVHGAEERVEVFRRVVGEDRHAVTGLRDLLQAHAHGLDAGVDLRAGDLMNLALAGLAEIPVADENVFGGAFHLRHRVEHFAHTGQGELIRDVDLALFIEELGHCLIDIH